MGEPRQSQSPVVCDLDGTLMYRNDQISITQIARHDTLIGPTAIIEYCNRKYVALLAQGVYDVYLCMDTWMMLHALSRRRPVICATGSPQSTIERRLHMLKFADAIAFETGARILLRQGEEFIEDVEWSSRFDQYRGALDLLAQRLELDGWQVDRAGREYTLRVRQAGERPMPLECVPAQFCSSFNLGNLDIYPKGAGKLNAIHYLLRRSDSRAMTYIGDDENDAQALGDAADPILMGHASVDLVRVAREQGWRVTEQQHIEGINRVLSELLEK